MIPNWLKRSQDDIWWGGIIFLLVLLSFGLGRLNASNHGLSAKIKFRDIKNMENLGNGIYLKNIEDFPNQIPKGESEKSIISQGELVGSKNSDKVHLKSCPGAGRIKDKNKIFFASLEEARKKGYIPAGNCPEIGY